MVYKCLYILTVLLSCCSGNLFSGIFNKHPLKRNNLAGFYTEDNNFNIVPSINEYNDEPEPSCTELKQWWRFISALIRASSHNNEIEDFSNLQKMFANHDPTIEKIGENEVVPETYSFGTFKDNSLKSVHRKTPEMANFASLGFDDSPQTYGEYDINDNSASETGFDGFGGFGGFGSFGGFKENGGSNSPQNGHFSIDNDNSASETGFHGVGGRDSFSPFKENSMSMGQFSTDKSGCKDDEDIEGKICNSDKDCSCNGFYRCNNKGKCSSSSTSGKASYEIGQFHGRIVHRRRLPNNN